MGKSQSVLEQIVLHKQEELIERRKAVPFNSLLKKAVCSDRSFEHALTQPGSRFIFEYKRASPSQGTINAKLTVDDICLAYNGHADAVSVLTDSRYFGGSFDFLKQIRNKVKVPVLCKDFILHPYQVVEARYYGADAILLMLSILDDLQYQECAAIAKQFDLDILTEVHSEEELSRAIKLEARIIGINNRNLKTLKVDIALTEKLAPLVPEDRVLVSESGITSRRDIVKLCRYVDGFLIGTALTRHKDVQSAVKKLLFSEIKICGVKTVVDVTTAIYSGATYLGLVFYEESPRYLSVKQAEILVDAVTANYVGVFVNETIEKISLVSRQLSLVAVQCHGDESVEFIKSLRQQLPTGCQIWKAITYDESIIRGQIEMFEPLVGRLIVDNGSSQTYGGTGKSFKWQNIETIQSAMRDPEKLILAGGVNGGNVQLLDSYPELSLDVSSGLEGQKGIKSMEKIREFFERRCCFTLPPHSKSEDDYRQVV